MKYRKQILWTVLGAILALYAGNWLYENMWRRPLAERYAKTRQMQTYIKRKTAELARARAASKQLAVWESQSLPSRSEVARSLYQAWLLELVDFAGLDNYAVTSGEPLGQKGMYQSISFSVRGRGSLDDLTRFLFEFYSAGHLHQVRSIAMTPVHGSDQLDLSLAIEGLILPSADREDRLSSGTAQRLASSSLEAYQPIVARNLFGIGSSPDATDHTYLTAVNYVNGQPEAWFDLRSEDRILKLRAGDRLEVGQFKGTVADIEDTDVILDLDGQRWLLTVGENLAQAFALPPKF